MTEPLTDLQAALRKACEQIANELGAAEMLSGPCMDAARIIERHLSPVVLAAEAELREWLAVNLPRIRHEAACQMLESVRGSLEAYPNGGGDIGIMEQVERIKAEAERDGAIKVLSWAARLYCQCEELAPLKCAIHNFIAELDDSPIALEAQAKEKP